jgi:hypothetical protein
MRIIRDTDAVEFTDPDGAVLYLLPAPTRRDVLASAKRAYDEALEELERLKDSGVDTDAILAEAEAESGAVEAAREAMRASLPSPAVRRLRFGALAVRLVMGDEAISGHQQLIETYDRMDTPSATWTDATVDKVWNAAIPSDADTRGEDADVALSEEPVSAAD